MDNKHSDKTDDKHSSEEFEKYSPQHPLPKDILEMGREETICQYCGISYLIHNEMKILEQKVIELNQQLSKLQGVEIENIDLKNQQLRLQKTVDHSQNVIKDKDKNLALMMADIANRDGHIIQIVHSMNQCETALQEERDNHTKLRKQHDVCKSELPTVANTVGCIQTDILSIKHELDDYNIYTTSVSQKLINGFSTVYRAHTEDLESLRSQIIESDKLCREQNVREQSLIVQLNECQQEITNYNQSYQSLNILQQRQDSQSKQLIQVQDELDTSLVKISTLSVEIAQLKQRIKSKTKEADDLQVQINRKETSFQQRLSLLQTELEFKDNEKLKLKSELLKVVNELCENQRLCERQSSAVSERSHIQTLYSQALSDIDALTYEREMIVTAHQKQIEELRNSFKMKLLEADKLPAKLEQMVNELRETCKQEKDSLEEDLQQSFTLEIDIIKQKHSDMLSTYQQDIDDLKLQLKLKNDNVYTELETRIKKLTKDHEKTTKQMFEKLTGKDTEIEALRRMNQNLETQITKFQETDADDITRLGRQSTQLLNELNNTKAELELLQQTKDVTTEEMSILQDTVRRECEERFELTEALSRAREQLMLLQRTSPSPSYNKHLPSITTDTDTHQHSSSIHRRNITDNTNPSPRPHGLPIGPPQRTNSVPSSRTNIPPVIQPTKRSNSVTNTVNIGVLDNTDTTHIEPRIIPRSSYTNNTNQQTGSVSDHRKRIAAALKRK